MWLSTLYRDFNRELRASTKSKSALVLMNPSLEDRQLGERVWVNADSLLVGSTVYLECFLQAVRRRPWMVVRGFSAAWGREEFYRDLGADIDVSKLPYRADAIELLRNVANDGVRVILVVEGAGGLARKIAEHLGLFTGCGAAEGVWTVPPSAAAGASAKTLIHALRPHQCVKNTLVFLPFLLAHEVRSTDKWAAALLMFAAFCLCASAGYVLNDIIDRGRDRQHPTRSRRPIASGALPLSTALWLPLPLTALAALCCAFLPPPCSLVLVAYLALTTLYWVAAKTLVMADVIVLAGLYLLRLLAGSLATGNTVSHWLLAFALALFLSLALSKRVSELIAWGSVARDHAPGRGYRAEDTPVLEMMAVASGFLACLIMVFYIQSPEILRLYRRPEYLWVGVVALLYWLGRLFIYAHRGQSPEDPLFFALQDKTTFGILLTAAALAFLAV